MGLNSSDCAYSLLSDFCKAFGANLLMKNDIFNGRAFSANCGFECETGICGAVSVFKSDYWAYESVKLLSTWMWSIRMWQMGSN